MITNIDDMSEERMAQQEARNLKRVIGFFILGIVIIALGTWWWIGRGIWLYPTQTNAAIVLDYSLDQGGTLGQTIIAAQAGLQAVRLRLALPDGTMDKALTFRLYDGPEMQQLIRETTVSTKRGKDRQFLTFDFEPIPKSRNVRYYFMLEAAEPLEKPVSLYGGGLDTYINGSAYINNVPVDAQLSMQLSYQRQAMAADMINRVLNSLPLVAITLIMVLLPGAAVLLWLWPRIELDVIEWTAICVGLSLSLYVILLALLRYTPVTLSRSSMWGLMVGFGVAAAIALLRNDVGRFTNNISNQVIAWAGKPSTLAFFIILILSLLVRIDIVKGIEVPFWADSYHHTLLAQLIIENGSLPTSWEPYALMQGISYHFGMHAMIAVFHWLTGLTTIKSVLLFGQVVNILAVLVAYLIGRRIGGDPWVGVFAALVTGLISQYPMFYVNWGRYTQLTGQVLLLALITTTWLLLSTERRSWRLLIINMLLSAGLALTHYRVIVFYASFVIVLLLVRWFMIRWQRHAIVEDITRLTLVAFGAGLLLFPRAIELIGGQLWSIKLSMAKEGMNAVYIREVHNAQLNLLDFVSPIIVGLSILGLVLGILRRKVGIVAIALWWPMLLLVTNPHWLGLPGSGLITNFAIHIGAFMIFSVLAGYFLFEAVHAFRETNTNVSWVVIILIGLLALWGARRQLSLLDTNGMLVTRPDVEAMDWIRENTPDDTGFLVNSRLAYGGWTVVGTDAGWWLPVLTGRSNITPPLLYATENLPYPEYAWDVYYRYQDLRTPNIDDQTLAAQMSVHSLDYVYIGQQRGRVWSEGETPLDPLWFQESPLFNQVYAEDGVRIFQLALAKGN